MQLIGVLSSSLQYLSMSSEQSSLNDVRLYKWSMDGSNKVSQQFDPEIVNYDKSSGSSCSRMKSSENFPLMYDFLVSSNPPLKVFCKVSTFVANEMNFVHVLSKIHYQIHLNTLGICSICAHLSRAMPCLLCGHFCSASRIIAQQFQPLIMCCYNPITYNIWCQLRQA